jgi:hypothetical protein
MSTCEIIAFKDGKPDVSMELRNAWGGSAFIWSCLYDKYIKDPAKPYDSWITNDSKQLWDLAKRPDIPMFMRAVHASTFDRAIVRRDDLPKFSAHLREFAAYFPAGDKVSHLLQYADFVDAHLDVEAIGFHGTSVSENLWYDWDEEAEESVPYDLATRTDHLDAYEYVNRFTEATNQA